MSYYLVAVIDGAQARFLTLEPAQFPECESGPNLIEHEGLSSATQALQDQDLWADTKTGRNRGSLGQAHSYDDHRQNHRIEFERRFAQTIAARIADLAQIHQAQQLLLVAEPQILGLMREVLMTVLPRTLKVSELTKDLSHLKPHELHEYLASKEFLPPCQKILRST